MFGAMFLCVSWRLWARLRWLCQECRLPPFSRVELVELWGLVFTSRIRCVWSLVLLWIVRFCLSSQCFLPEEEWRLSAEIFFWRMHGGAFVETQIDKVSPFHFSDYYDRLIWDEIWENIELEFPDQNVSLKRRSKTEEN